MRKNNETLILSEKDFSKIRPLIFDNGEYALPVQVNSPDGAYGPLVVYGPQEVLDTLEELVKS